uniref:SAM domain-containing protein n=1 Tax=Proboscia inermis TaxID=420281 RepID=A0A7S0CCT3_9STRA|mmetsp:Transcript_3750/g.3861  ORF Transcript_3750/g.3861 Transcript_3750/m.3861 type:complete len:225 (+) Transcript_3750:44-718(+)|eukprot:CAMPEP_0171295514 /NCGR_PEP_ID=MMETSP0816-20121228/4097_1 /TAXON_ID=420281 /ORGANISM="Proboscia inermis, Strain CCAP1064/1" /LENGTH=224 /DNA_ID=CAMNT_0011768213 /DNA_START=40 /DNA_END=714 /DNA_ORIENTATION=-
MSEYDLKDPSKWSTKQLCAYLKKDGVSGDITATFAEQNIDGSIAYTLTEAHLQEMGVKSIGDRQQILRKIEVLKKSAKLSERTAVLWQGQGPFHTTFVGKLMKTCCYCCPEPQIKYKLVGNTYSETTIWKGGIGPNMLRDCQCCCGDTEDVDNVDLTQVQDIDSTTVPANCCEKCFCCGVDYTVITINTKNDKEDKTIEISKSAGKEAYLKINNQVENGQPMAR